MKSYRAILKTSANKPEEPLYDVYYDNVDYTLAPA